MSIERQFRKSNELLGVKFLPHCLTHSECAISISEYECK